MDTNELAHGTHGGHGAHGGYGTHEASGAHSMRDMPGTTGDWLTFTGWDAAVLAVLLAVLASYALLAWRTRGGAGGFDRRSAFAFILGLAVVFVAISSPFAFLRNGSHLGYMAQLELLMTISPPLLLLGLRPISGFLSKGNGFAGGLLRTISAPALMLGIWLATVYVWHVPALHMLGKHSQAAYQIQLLSYVGAGLRPPTRSMTRTSGLLSLSPIGGRMILLMLSTISARPARCQPVSSVEV